MENISDITKLLRLSRNEQLVLKALDSQTQLVSFLNKKIDIPRVTLDRTLNSLHKRGLAQKKKFSKKRVGWAIKLDFMRKTESKPDNYKVELIFGKDALMNAVNDFINTTKNSRAFAIQNEMAWRAWINTLSEDTINDLHKSFEKNKIILDTIISDNFEKTLLKNGYSRRPSSLNVIPDKFLHTDIDIEINRKYLLIMNWNKQEGIKINDPDIAKFFSGILEYIIDSSKKLNIHSNFE